MEIKIEKKSDFRTIPECEPEKKEDEDREKNPEDWEPSPPDDPPKPRNNYGHFIFARVRTMNYRGILERVQNHLGVHPFKVSLTDANAAKAGNQKIEAQFASGTAAMRKIVELSLENKGDAAVWLNLLVRMSVAIAQILQVTTIASKGVRALASYIRMPIKEKISYIKMPFDISLGQRKKQKGFDPKKQKEATIKEIKIQKC